MRGDSFLHDGAQWFNYLNRLLQCRQRTGDAGPVLARHGSPVNGYAQVNERVLKTIYFNELNNLKIKNTEFFTLTQSTKIEPCRSGCLGLHQ